MGPVSEMLYELPLKGRLVSKPGVVFVARELMERGGMTAVSAAFPVSPLMMRELVPCLQWQVGIHGQLSVHGCDCYYTALGACSYQSN